MFLSLVHMLEFWCQILVQLANDFGAKFQTCISEKEICGATIKWKKTSNNNFSTLHIQLKPPYCRIYNRLKSTICFNVCFFSLIFCYDTVVRGHSQTTLTRYWPLLTIYLPPVDIFWRNSFTEIRENLHTVDISCTTYLPRLVNVVCECP